MGRQAIRRQPDLSAVALAHEIAEQAQREHTASTEKVANVTAFWRAAQQRAANAGQHEDKVRASLATCREMLVEAEGDSAAVRELVRAEESFEAQLQAVQDERRALDRAAREAGAATREVRDRYESTGAALQHLLARRQQIVLAAELHEAREELAEALGGADRIPWDDELDADTLRWIHERYGPGS